VIVFMSSSAGCSGRIRVSAGKSIDVQPNRVAIDSSISKSRCVITIETGASVTRVLHGQPRGFLTSEVPPIGRELVASQPLHVESHVVALNGEHVPGTQVFESLAGT
jgi:hypothetical protein